MNVFNDEPPSAWDRGVAKAKETGHQVMEFLRRIFPPLRTKPQKDEAERKRKEREQDKEREREREQGRGPEPEREPGRGPEPEREPVGPPMGPDGDQRGPAGTPIGVTDGQGAEPARRKPTREEIRAELEKLAEEAGKVTSADLEEQIRAELRSRVLGDDSERPRPVPVPVSEEAQRAAEEIKADLRETLEDELGGGFGSSGGKHFEVHFHPTERRISAVRGPKRAAEKGTAITRIERLPVDGMVFDRKRPGGSVVIDQSGSMQLSYEAVAEAIQHFPALTIARYSGSGDTGTLCVLAENGLLGELNDCNAGGGNDVDIEALSWLAKQPEPRVWVSDGWVCGGLVATLGPEQAHAVITSLCQRKGIVRVDTFEEAVKVLQRGITRGVAVEPRDADFLPNLSLHL